MFLQTHKKSMGNFLKCIPRGQLSSWLLLPPAAALWSGPSPPPGHPLSPHPPTPQKTRQNPNLLPNHRQGPLGKCTN